MIFFTTKMTKKTRANTLLWTASFIWLAFKISNSQSSAMSFSFGLLCLVALHKLIPNPKNTPKSMLNELTILQDKATKTYHTTIDPLKSHHNLQITQQNAQQLFLSQDYVFDAYQYEKAQTIIDKITSYKNRAGKEFIHHLNNNLAPSLLHSFDEISKQPFFKKFAYFLPQALRSHFLKQRINPKDSFELQLKTFMHQLNQYDAKLFNEFSANFDALFSGQATDVVFVNQTQHHKRHLIQVSLNELYKHPTQVLEKIFALIQERGFAVNSTQIIFCNSSQALALRQISNVETKSKKDFDNTVEIIMTKHTPPYTLKQEMAASADDAISAKPLLLDPLKPDEAKAIPEKKVDTILTIPKHTPNPKIMIKHKNRPAALRNTQASSTDEASTIDATVATLHQLYKDGKAVLINHKIEENPENITQLKRLEAEFNRIYYTHRSDLEQHIKYNHIIYWLNMITLIRHKAQRHQSFNEDSKSQDSLEKEVEKIDITKDMRENIVRLFRQALKEYETEVNRIRHKIDVEKNPRYKGVYKTTLELYKTLDNAIIFFEDDGTLEDLVACYENAFAISKNELQKNRSQPWFKFLVSDPIEKLKLAINYIVDTYYQWYNRNIAQTPVMIEKPFFKKAQTHSNLQADKLEKEFQDIINTNKPKTS